MARTRPDRSPARRAPGILGLVAWGDASLAAAKSAGGIKEVHSLEYKDFNILFIYHQGCTEVHGE